MDEEAGPAMQTDVREQETGRQQPDPSRFVVIALAVAFAGGAFLYRLLFHAGFGHSSAMFLGVPALLAILLALTPKAKSVTGGIVKGITLALLILAPLLGEGWFCILVAAPLFYVVGIVVGLAVDWQRGNRKATLSCVAVVLLPMCLEGVLPELTLPRGQTVRVSRVVAGSPDDVEAALAQSPRVGAPLPRALRAGFPHPMAAWGQGLGLGATRTIHFSAAEGAPEGDLVMRVVETRPGYARFVTVSDGSKLAQWLRWRSSEVSWHAVDTRHTEVTWEVRFDRALDPAWYFTPLERAAVRQAAAYLITANAEPQEATR